MITHLWPTLDPVASVEEALGGVRARGHARRAAPQSPTSEPVASSPTVDEGADCDHTRVRPRSPTTSARSPSPATTPRWPTGSVLVEFGRTRVLCTASLEERVPPWLKGSGKGWVTAEYSMLPGSSPERVDREAARGKQSGRTQEIQRLIGRSLRAVTDLRLMPDVQITVDCDVLQADGGTRTASICGGWIALHDACSRLLAERHARAGIRCCSRARRSRSASSTARRCSTSSTPKTCAPRST